MNFKALVPENKKIKKESLLYTDTFLTFNILTHTPTCLVTGTMQQADSLVGLHVESRHEGVHKLPMKDLRSL